MSHKATNWLASLDAKLIGHSEFRVLFHLCDCHNPSAGCFPTQAYLMDQTGASNGTVNNALNALQHKGLIQRHRQFDGTSKRQKPTRYTLGFEMKGTGKGELSPKTDVRGAKPTPNIGDGAGSNLGGNPSSIQKSTLYTPGFEKKGTGKGEMSPKTEVRGAKPTPNIGDGAVSNLEGDPSPAHWRGTCK